MERLAVQPGLAHQIYHFQSTITKELRDAIPFEPDRILKDIKYKLDIENYELRDDAAGVWEGEGVSYSILNIVEKDILSRVIECDSKTDSKIKLGAVSALVGIIETVVSMPQNGEWGECF